MLLLINVLLLVSQIQPGLTIDVQVETDIGTIIGHTKDIHFNGTRYTVREFLGISFAEAPIGPLRFAKPVKKAPFTEPYIAQTASPLCPQNPQYLAFLGITGGLENQVEDCLTLNVFTPDRPVRGKKLPVLVWIHGGFYEVQTQDYFLGKMLPATQDIIFVTMNYRLTVLGFLSTGNGSELPENNGLWDQHLALKWVQDHIECFGGDPRKVTIAGNSAGSMSSVHHALYRGSKGLFRSVIAHSGTANNLARLEDKPLTKFLAIANATGCMASSQGEMIECLRNLPLAALIAKTTIDLYYAPVVDGEFIELHPDEVFANNSTKAHNILCHYGMYNIIYGLNSDEANAYMRPVDYAVAVGTDVIAGYTLNNFKNIVIPLILSENRISYSPSPELTEAIVELYLGDIDTSNNVQIREQTIDFLSDTIFNAGVIKSAQVHANTKLKGNTYLFIFHHRSIISKPGREGSTHGEENIFALGFPMVKLEYIYDITFTDPATVFTQEDLQLSLDMMTYWGNYVKTGYVVLPAKSDSDFMFCLHSYQGLIIDRSFVY